MCIAGKTAGVLKLFSLAVGVGAPAASFCTMESCSLLPLYTRSLL